MVFRTVLAWERTAAFGKLGRARIKQHRCVAFCVFATFHLDYDGLLADIAANDAVVAGDVLAASSQQSSVVRRRPVVDGEVRAAIASASQPQPLCQAAVVEWPQSFEW